LLITSLILPVKIRTQMSNTTKTEVIHDDGKYFVTQDSDDPYVPFACPNCNIALKDSFDIQTYNQFNCCMWCKSMFISGEVAEQRWVSGWRPAAGHITMLLSAHGLI